MTQMEAYLKVSEQLPIDDPGVLRRLERADRDIVGGYGYGILANGDGTYTVDKLSTAPLGAQDNGHAYLVSTEECNCPDYPTARGNLCKHRLAIMIYEAMHLTQEEQ